MPTVVNVSGRVKCVKYFTRCKFSVLCKYLMNGYIVMRKEKNLFESIGESEEVKILRFVSGTLVG